jgi:hypothetical protein
MNTSRELDKKAKLYLLEAMRDHLDGYDIYKPETMDNRQVIEAVQHHFRQSHDWLIISKGEDVAITEWLQGLALPIDFTYCDIIQLAKDWGSIPQDATAKQEDKICDNYFRFMANKVRHLFAGFHVPQEVTA